MIPPPENREPTLQEKESIRQMLSDETLEVIEFGPGSSLYTNRHLHPSEPAEMYFRIIVVLEYITKQKIDPGPVFELLLQEDLATEQSVRMAIEVYQQVANDMFSKSFNSN